MPEAVLKGRVALVTGVSRRKGIGFAITQQLAMLGADVFIHSFSPYDATQTWGADPDGISALIALLQKHGTRKFLHKWSQGKEHRNNPKNLIAALDKAISKSGHHLLGNQILTRGRCYLLYYELNDSYHY